MHYRLLIAAFLVFLSAPAQAQTQSGGAPSWLESITVEGGPVASKHFQSGSENFRDHHTVATVRVDTRGYGNWGLYLLTPNSVNRTSVGAGYITDPYVIPFGNPFQLELTAALGLVTGYRDYPVPLITGEARLVLYRQGPWDAGVAMGISPYIMEDETRHENHFGVVAISPFLSVRYTFN